MSAESPLDSRRGRIATAIIAWVGFHIGGKDYDEYMGRLVRLGAEVDRKERTVSFEELRGDGAR